MKDFIKNNSGLFFWCLGVLFLLITNLPYLNYALHQKDGYVYTGATPQAAADKLVYMSMIQQGREGILFMRNLHTTDPQQGLQLSPHWYIIGQTGRLLGISNVASYIAYRIVLTLVFLMVLWYLVRRLFRSHTAQLGATALVLLGGGLGWFKFITNPRSIMEADASLKFLTTPIDMYVAEGVTLQNFTQSPLFIGSQLLIVGIFFLLLKFRTDRRWWPDIVNAFLVAFLVIIHPYDLPIILAIGGSWAVWFFWRTGSWLVARKIGLIALGGVLAIAYHAWVLAIDPTMASWYNQNLVYSPPFSGYMWGYGFLLLFWAIGVWRVLVTKRNHEWWMLILIWSVLTWVLLYLPLTINRRFVNAFHIALALVAFEGVRYMLHQCHRTWLKIVYSIAVCVVLFGHIGFAIVLGAYFEPSMYTYYYYISPEERHAIDFLRKTTRPEDGLFILENRTAFSITSQLNRPVYRGHDHQTPNFYLRQQQLDWFAFNHTDTKIIQRKEAFIRSIGTPYIIVNHNRLTQPVWWIDQVNFVEKLYSSGGFDIYRVRPISST